MNKSQSGQKGYSGKIPVAAIIAFERELVGLLHGTATLTIHVRYGKLERFATGRERSFIPEQAETETCYVVE
jgi:hypothetical protein